MKVLDSDVCVEILRSNEDVIKRRLREPDLVVTTWINASELHFGAANSKAPKQNRQVVEDFLATLPLLGIDAAAARIFGEVKAGLRRRGAIVPDADLWVGAIAAAFGAVVVTGNTAHFDRMPGIRTENWLRPR